MQEEVFRHFAQCPVCSATYRGARLVMVHGTRDRSVFHITCTSCKVSVLLTLARGDAGTMCVGALSDLRSDEVQRALSAPITPDDVLDAYTTITAHRGSLRDLLEPSASVTQSSYGSTKSHGRTA